MDTRTTYAAFEQALLIHDQPELIVLKVNDNTKVVAVAIDRVSDRQFFGARVSVTQFYEYLDERFDLRYLLTNPDRFIWYKFDLVEQLWHIPLSRYELSRSDAHILPEHGFFARDHSEEYEIIQVENRTPQTFFVDGNWSMPDFSKFHSQFADLYALVKGDRILKDDTVEQKTKRSVIDAVTKPYEGGGSYLAAFRGLASVGGREAKPDIEAIRWASPGYIKVLASKPAFDKVIEMVSAYGRNADTVTTLYDHLWSYLSETRLLKASVKSAFITEDVRNELRSRTRQLISAMDGLTFQEMNRLSGESILITAKLALAASRRTEKLYQFFLQGRLAVDGAKFE